MNTILVANGKIVKNFDTGISLGVGVDL